MKRFFFSLVLLASTVGFGAAQTPPQAWPFPAVGSIVLQSDPKLGVGYNEYLAYLLPADQGGFQKFRIVQGLANPKYVSFESVQYPGYYLRHQACQIKLHPFAENDDLYAADATFIPVANSKVPGGWMFRAYSPSWLWLSVTRNNALYAAPNPRYEDSTFVIGN